MEGRLLCNFNDIHTHTPDKVGSILSVPAEGVESVVMRNLALPAEGQQYYSIQLHPWHLVEGSVAAFLDVVGRYADDPHFVAVGECGLDGLCTTPLPMQLEALRTALQAAQRCHKPVIIHCVRMWSEIIAEVKPYISAKAEGQQFVIHGFRKGPALARRLLDAGFCLSLGRHYHPEVPKIIPPDRLFHETDEE